MTSPEPMPKRPVRIHPLTGEPIRVASVELPEPPGTLGRDEDSVDSPAREMFRAARERRWSERAGERPPLIPPRRPTSRSATLDHSPETLTRLENIVEQLEDMGAPAAVRDTLMEWAFGDLTNTDVELGPNATMSDTLVEWLESARRDMRSE